MPTEVINVSSRGRLDWAHRFLERTVRISPHWHLQECL